MVAFRDTRAHFSTDTLIVKGIWYEHIISMLGYAVPDRASGMSPLFQCSGVPSRASGNKKLKHAAINLKSTLTHGYVKDMVKQSNNKNIRKSRPSTSKRSEIRIEVDDFLGMLRDVASTKDLKKFLT
nr:hypothetical protein [Tanacetum cinerariifolium]